MARAHVTARLLAQRIVTIADPSVRVRYLRSEVREADPAEIADLLTVCVHGAESRDGDQSALLLALCVALADDEHSELRAAIARAAIEQGQHATAALLSPETSRCADPPVVPDFGAGRPLTLGERKSLARRRDRDLIARVLRDPSPDVIRVLLENPSLTEDDVIRLCARRPIAGEVIREVFLSTRWIVRYRVRRAIVNNPFSPSDLALQLAVHLDAKDAREVVGSAELPDAVREACRRVARMDTLH